MTNVARPVALVARGGRSFAPESVAAYVICSGVVAPSPRHDVIEHTNNAPHRIERVRELVRSSSKHERGARRIFPSRAAFIDIVHLRLQRPQELAWHGHVVGPHRDHEIVATI